MDEFKLSQNLEEEQEQLKKQNNNFENQNSLPTNSSFDGSVTLDKNSFQLNEEEQDKYAVYFATTQSHTIKTLVESLKDIINDATFIFNKFGIQIVNVNAEKTVIVSVKLVASQFNYYFCASSEEIILHIKSLFFLLKTVVNGDIIKMYMLKKNKTRLFIEICNKNRNVCDRSELILLDCNIKRMHIPNVRFDSVVTMNSSHFQKIIKDLSHISDRVTVTSTDKTLSFAVQGEIGSKNITCKQEIDDLSKKPINEFQIKVPGEEIKQVKETYDLSYLLSFIKSTNLCTTINLFLKQEFPLVVIYSVGSLGSLTYALLPFVDPYEPF